MSRAQSPFSSLPILLRPSPALPEFPQPRLGALLHSPKACTSPSSRPRSSVAPAAVAAAQRGT